MIKKLFNLFELDRLRLAKEEVEEDTLVRLVGGVMRCFRGRGLVNVESDYRNSKLFFPSTYPERMWRLHGNDFNVDLWDAGNGWYQIVKVEVLLQ